MAAKKRKKFVSWKPTEAMKATAKLDTWKTLKSKVDDKVLQHLVGETVIGNKTACAHTITTSAPIDAGIKGLVPSAKAAKKKCDWCLRVQSEL